MSVTNNREIRISGNGKIQRFLYDSKMNCASWKPTIWYRHERKKEAKQ